MPTITKSRSPSAPIAPSNGLARDGLCLRIPTSALTLAGFRDWVKSDGFPEKLRVAFIDQEIYIDMSKEEIATHAAVKAAVCRVLLNLTHEQRLGYFYLDGVLVTSEKAEVSNNPDGVLVGRDNLQAGRVRLVPGKGEKGEFMEIEGAPDWVMEIVSKGSVTKDTVKLRNAYHQAGIREYWLIDARGEEIEFQILYWRKKGYAAAPNQKGWQKSRVFGCSFRLVRQRDDLGLWEYTLEVQPT